MCTTHLHHHQPCSHITPCLPANVISHCPLVQARLSTYHDQPNQLPRLYPLQIPEVCAPPPSFGISHRDPGSSLAPQGIRYGVDGSLNERGEERGNVCVWIVAWGCGRGGGSLCRVGWGDLLCPWVSGMAGGGGGGGRDGGGGGGGRGGGVSGVSGRGGRGGRGGGGGEAGGVGRGGMSGVENTRDVTRTRNGRNTTDASGVVNPTRATGTGEVGADREGEERLEDPTTIMKPTSPTLMKNLPDAEKLSDETADDDGNDPDNSREEEKERREAHLEEIQEQDEKQKPKQHKEEATETERGEEEARRLVEQGKEEEKNIEGKVAIEKEKGIEKEYVGYILNEQIHFLHSYS